MRPFNLDEYLAKPSKEVITKDGRKVQIRCTDVRSAIYPIVALVEKYNLPEDCVFTYTRDGRHFACQESDDDLFFASTKHEGWVNILKNSSDNRYIEYARIFETKEAAEESVKGDSDYIATIKIEWEE